MTTEEARAIWEGFDDEVSDALLRAVAGAFAFVACADAHLAEAEVERFVGWVRGEPAFVALDGDALEARFRALAAAFASDFAAGERAATEAVTAVADDEVARELVLRAAQVAVVADERLEEVEEVALRRLCEVLGVDPDDR